MRAILDPYLQMLSRKDSLNTTTTESDLWGRHLDERREQVKRLGALVSACGQRGGPTRLVTLSSDGTKRRVDVVNDSGGWWIICAAVGASGMSQRRGALLRLSTLIIGDSDVGPLSLARRLDIVPPRQSVGFGVAYEHPETRDVVKPLLMPGVVELWGWTLPELPV